MIVTLTLNPAIDKSITIDHLVPEKKMRCESPEIEPGGGGINISKAIKELGGNSNALFTYGGINGSLLSQLMHDAGIQTTPIPIEGETRESLVVNEISTGKQYRFVMPGPALSPAEVIAIKKALNGLVDITYLIVSGSLPPGVSPEFIGELAEQAKARNIKLVVDTSGDALKYAFEKGVFLLKPNLSELCALAGKKYLAVNEIEAVATRLIRNSACEILVVSMGPEGALLVTKEGAKRFYAPPVKKISTVGAGDSMVAGIVWMLEQNEPVEKAVPFGIACGTAATVYTGPGLFQKSDVLHLLQSVTNEAPVPY